MVGGDPAILNDCGNELMTASITMDGGRTSMAQHQTMPSTVAARAAMGVGLETAYSQAVDAMMRAANNLQSTVADDGHHLQRGSRDIDSAMNGGAGGGVGAGGGGAGGGGGPRGGPRPVAI